MTAWCCCHCLSCGMFFGTFRANSTVTVGMRHIHPLKAGTHTTKGARQNCQNCHLVGNQIHQNNDETRSRQKTTELISSAQEWRPPKGKWLRSMWKYCCLFGFEKHAVATSNPSCGYTSLLLPAEWSSIERARRQSLITRNNKKISWLQYLVLARESICYHATKKLTPNRSIDWPPQRLLAASPPPCLSIFFFTQMMALFVVRYLIQYWSVSRLEATKGKNWQSHRKHYHEYILLIDNAFSIRSKWHYLEYK